MLPFFCSPFFFGCNYIFLCWPLRLCSTGQGWLPWVFLAMENLESLIPITLDGPDTTLDVSSDLSQLKFICAQISEVTNKSSTSGLWGSDCQFVRLGTFPPCIHTVCITYPCIHTIHAKTLILFASIMSCRELVSFYS